MATNETNWAGNYAYQATRIHRPASMDELCTIVAGADKLHALGSRHAFNAIADSDELVSLDRLNNVIEIDHDGGVVNVGAGTRYGDLATALDVRGFALHNMASLPHISVGGAIATATHGSGDASGNLATAVAALELVTSDGEIRRFSRGDEDFAGMVVSLGALGVVTRVTLDVQPATTMRQQVYRHLAWDVLFDRFDEITTSGDSVSLFTTFGADVEQVWQKRHVTAGEPETMPDDLFGATATTVPLHPVERLPADACTEQLGVAGPWHTRLPHFRPDAVPASGDEIQAEYMVARHHAVDAIQAVCALGDVIRPHLWISEVRTVAADELWLSSAWRRDTVCIHFSWTSDPAAVNRVLPLVEAALEPFAARPHWGKVFQMEAPAIAARYERLPEFCRLRERLDPRGAFRNAFLDRLVFA